MGCTNCKISDESNEPTMSEKNLRININKIKKIIRLKNKSSLATVFEVPSDHECSER